MATAVLTVVGYTFGGPLGAYVGAMVGSYIDQNYLFPQKIEGPRLTDLKVMASTYGSPIPLVYGGSNRISGNLIWTTGLIESVRKRKQGGKGGGATVKEYSYRASVAIALGEGTLTNLLRVWGDGKVIFDLTVASPPVVTSGVNGWSKISPVAQPEVRFYNGSFTQDPDPSLEAHLGVGNTPAYRGTAYVVITDLPLADFGNRIPNLEFEVDGLTPRTADAVVNDICLRAGLGQGEYATGSAPATTVRGYPIATAGNAMSAIEPMLSAYFMDAVDQGGAVRFIARGLGPKATIPIEDMGALESNETKTGKTPIQWTRTPEVNMARTVTVTAKDPDRDYNENSQQAEHPEGDAATELSVGLPLVMSASETRRIADAVLWALWSGRGGAKWSLSDRHDFLKPGDAIHAVIAGQTIYLVMVSVQRGANGVIECEARFEDPAAFQSTNTGEAATNIETSITIPGATTLYLLNIPLLPGQTDDEGFYWGVDASDDNWRGADIYRSVDSGTTYSEMASSGIRSITGTVSGIVPSGPTTVWDRATTITVTLLHSEHELESLDEALILNGSNGAYIGEASGTNGEIIQWATATLVSPGVYQLSNLLRGRLGTEANVGIHTSGEIFVMLEKDILGSSNYSSSDWDAARVFKPVSIYTEITAATAQNFTNTGEKKRPWSPVHGQATRDASNNLTITWVRRTRYTVPSVAGPAPLGEESESYEIDVYSGASVVRTITASSASASYTAAEQSTDGLTPGDPVSIRIYQMSASRGRGHAGIFTV